MGTRVGVDEAGKGPVFGPMVISAVRAPGGTIPDGVDDSKALSADRRSALARQLRDDDRISTSTVSISPDEIDDPDTDMTGLTVTGHVRALTQLVTDGDSVVVDAGDVDAGRFADRVAGGLDGQASKVTVEAEHGADATYTIVGAASILAKQHRDAVIESLAARHGEIGSGYPSDPTTRTYLREYVAQYDDVPPFARRSWSTCEDALAAAEQSNLADF